MVKFFSTKKSILTEKSQLLHGPIFPILLEKKILENVININIVEQSRRRGFFLRPSWLLFPEATNSAHSRQLKVITKCRYYFY
jgi:hypothetical protein